MSPLEQLRAEQHDEQRLDSDQQLEAFLAEIDLPTALRDREPTTDVERRHLAQARRTA